MRHLQAALSRFSVRLTYHLSDVWVLELPPDPLRPIDALRAEVVIEDEFGEDEFGHRSFGETVSSTNADLA